jgi:hypothetical protein
VSVEISTHSLAEDLVYKAVKSITILDRGRGPAANQLQSNGECTAWFDAFYSTSPSRSREPTYHYSRMFGAPYSGAGMGLLRSKVECYHKMVEISLFLRLILSRYF